MVASKIMLLENEDAIAMDIRNQLIQFGYELVATAFSCGQALTFANEYRPDLVLIDCGPNQSSEIISTTKLLTNSFHIPVIFFSAHSDLTFVQHLNFPGIYGYLSRPFRQDELYITIKLALQNHQMYRDLGKKERWLEKTLSCLNHAMIATDAKAQISFINPLAEAITGWQLEDIKSVDIRKFLNVLEDERENLNNPVTMAMQNLETTLLPDSASLISKSGEEILIDGGITPILSEEGSVLGVVITFRDNTAHRHQEEIRKYNQECFQKAFDNASIGMALVALDGRFLLVNSVLSRIFGYSEQELLAANLKILTHHADNLETGIGHQLQQLLLDKLPSFHIEAECYHKIIGKVIWTLISVSLVRNDITTPEYFIVQIQNITDRKYEEQKLLYIANHDPLTGLCNRIQLHDRLTQALSRARRQKTKLALMFIDVDCFKIINDAFGHRIGNLLLKAVADRLKDAVRSNDTLARLGGDEFIVLLNDMTTTTDMARVAQKMIELLTQPFTIEDHVILAATNIGISVFPDDSLTSQALLMNSDTAMYQAKERGNNTYQFYTLEITSSSIERMAVERDLQQALLQHEFKLHYQPQISLANSHGVGVEALLRWQHPLWGFVYPDRFMEIAEQTGLIVPIGAWMLRMACFQTKLWQENDGVFTHVAVNVSHRQFVETGFFEMVSQVLDETYLSPSSLELEINESAIIHNPEKSLQVLHKLNALGVRLSIDNFGAGHSSLTYLQRFPISAIKIDRSLVSDIPENQDSMKLLRGIIALSRELKLQVTVKGVETDQQLAFLKDQHCDVLQGYIFSKPATAKQLDANFKLAPIQQMLRH